MNIFKKFWETYIYNPKARVIACSLRNYPHNWYSVGGRHIHRKTSSNLFISIGDGLFVVALHTSNYETSLGVIGNFVVWKECMKIIERDSVQHQKIKQQKTEEALKDLDRMDS